MGQGEQQSSSITKERDELIARCPLLNMIRNPRCMYYVPYKPKEKVQAQYKSARPEMELPEFELDTGAGTGLDSQGTNPTGVRSTGHASRLSTASMPAMDHVALDWED